MSDGFVKGFYQLSNYWFIFKFSSFFKESLWFLVLPPSHCIDIWPLMIAPAWPPPPPPCRSGITHMGSSQINIQERRIMDWGWGGSGTPFLHSNAIWKCTIPSAVSALKNTVLIYWIKALEVSKLHRQSLAKPCILKCSDTLRYKCT